jgi:iron complex outermembrane receptor protein
MMKSTFAFLFLTLPIISNAQLKEVELNPVTITATLQPLPVSRTGRNIISIPGDYFDKLPVHSIDELLRFVPGVEVQMRGPSGSQSDIVLRGGTFQQVLIILDGQRLNDPNTGHFNSYIPIAPTEIEKIEILKGASSAIYGSEAVGGVINIITKSFSAKRNQQKKQLVGSATAGEYAIVQRYSWWLLANEKYCFIRGTTNKQFRWAAPKRDERFLSQSYSLCFIKAVHQ